MTAASIRDDAASGRVVVDVPPSLNSGKRMRRFFPDRNAAEIFAAECQVAIVRDGRIAPQPVLSGSPLRVVVACYLADKKPEVCAGHYKVAANHLGKLVKKFGHMKPDELQPMPCREWLRDLPLSQRTRFGVFSTCRSFYRWAVRYDYAERNPLDKMEPIPRGTPPKAILTPEQMKTVLATEMPDCVRAWVVLGGFCGLRPIEVYRLDWSAVDLRSKEIHIGAGVIKRDALRGRGVRERFVAIPANALKMIKPGRGPVVPLSKNPFSREVARLSAALGLKSWPHDCLRHSAASYMLALKGDAGWVAHWLGHTTTRMVYDAYAQAVKKSEARKWYAIQGPQ